MLDINKKSLEKVIIVGLIKKADDFNQSIEYLDELEFLVKTAGGIVVRRITQKMRVPNPKTFIGSGKLHHIKSLIKLNEVSSVVFDDELSATQQFNLEKLLKSKIMDRTALILDIFAQRAKTSYARTQVELAQYEYFLAKIKRALDSP